MAREFFTYSCGCEGKTYSNSRKEAQSKAAWLAGKDCFKCERELAAARAAMEADKQGLPKLIGSEKQITWAEQIRADALKAIGNKESLIKFADMADEPLEAAIKQHGRKKAEDIVQAFKTGAADGWAKLHEETQATWWIDNRVQITNYINVAAYEAVAKVVG